MDDPGSAPRERAIEETEAPTNSNPGDVPQEAKSREKAPAPETPTGKAIVLFSDGTGNSSAKLFKTNVWRMYEAVDLGPPAPDRREQIAFYDNGVGTSGIGILAAITGIFGYGLKRNVLEIYRYACRNYRRGPGQKPGTDPEGQGDELYGFGFSRGGFTMRIVTALIASQGLVAAQSEGELQRKSLDAYRAFRKSFEPRMLSAPILVIRAIRDAVIGLSRWIRRVPAYNPAENYFPVIRFLGIWDTVGAYGGPIVELTRAIDDWIFPLSMPDLQLSERVLCARHALAIDDSRDAFHPLLWDEVHEAELIEDEKVAPDRLRQLWFAGMHADVGGGYPDESLSYISLLWILEEANKAGLRTLDVITERHRALASSFGPIHDSRSGPGAYYRYQPRRIGAWVDPPEKHTGILRDPSLRNRDRSPRGLLRAVQIHESVVARIADGTDNYAPITLPAAFEIAPPQQEGENAPQRDSEGGDVRPLLPWRRMIPPEVRARLADPEVAAAREEGGRLIWDAVLVRRVVYFATLAVTAWLVLLPFLSARATPVEKMCSDDRCVLPWLISQTKILLPKFAERWVDKYAADPGTFAVLLAVVLFLLSFGGRIEAATTERSRHLWLATLGRCPWPEPPRFPFAWLWAVVRFIRTNPLYQFIVRLVKWDLLPRIIGWALIAALLYGFTIIVTQLWLALAEPRSRFCSNPVADPPVAQRFEKRDFDARSTCTFLDGSVRQKAVYRITLTNIRSGDGTPGKWVDGNFETSPQGLDASEMRWVGRLGAPLRRVVGARYMQPLVEIRGADARRWWPGVHIQKVAVKPDGLGGYSGEFTARRTGSLHLFVNDVAMPLGLAKRFYRNNRGYADVIVEELRPPPEG